jgi:Mn-dependent DtxR family transcriptional regulator
MPSLQLQNGKAPKRRIAVVLGRSEWQSVVKELKRLRKEGVIEASVSHIVRSLIREHLH